MNISRKLPAMVLAMSVIFCASRARADVKLHTLFSDDMVLQRDKPAPVWGVANPNEKILVSIGKQTKGTQANAGGNWRVILDAMPAASGQTLTVKGDNEIVLKNIAVGDVYLCSGQSNMQMALKAAKNGDAEVAAASYSDIRFFTVRETFQQTPLKDLAWPANWQVCTPESAADFSVVAYFFGRELNTTLKVPIGLIDASWGGTVAEAWTSREALEKMPYFAAQIPDQNPTAPGVIVSARVQAWAEANDNIGSKDNAFAKPDFDDSAWKELTLPPYGKAGGLPDFDGIVWFRKSVEVAPELAGKPLSVTLGSIGVRDVTFWNGVPIGAGTVFSARHDYPVPPEMVLAGRNVLAVRMIDTSDGGGLHGGRMADGDTVRVSGPGSTISLDGTWKYQPGLALKELTPAPVDYAATPNQPTVLFNGMIAPLVPSALRGVLWYQGESNVGDPVHYRALFPALIRDWRTHFGQQFGFYFVQLPRYYGGGSPVEYGWADLREAQATALALPHTGMATTADIGGDIDLHPKDKQTVGKRLALAALAMEYGQKIEYSGPTFKELKTEGDKIRIKFSHAQGLKTSDGGAPKGFVVAGDDGKFVWATAIIEGETVVLFSTEVKLPKRVRYAWGNDPQINVYNAAELPAVPFRTDNER